MRTILHISKYYFPTFGGIETVARYLAEGMKSYKNIVICFSSDNKYHEDEIKGVPVYRVPVNFFFMSQGVAFSYYVILKRLIKLYNPDCCHVHCPNPYVYPIVTKLIPKQTKLVLHWHSDILGKGLMYLVIRPFENAILKRCDRIITTSPNYMLFSKPLAPYSAKVCVAQNGIITSNLDLSPGEDKRVEEIRQLYSGGIGKPIVFFVGRHIPYKGIDTLINADAYIKSDCTILIAGDGPMDNYLKSMTHSNRVKFIGRPKMDELRLYLHAASIFAFPSNTKAEAFGVAMAEAMYCKCAPVVFFIKDSGINWVSLKDITGMEVPLGDIKAYAEAIDTIISDKQLREQYAEAAHQRIMDNFTSDKAVSRMTEIYSALFQDVLSS